MENFTVTRPLNRESGEEAAPGKIDYEYFIWLCNRVKLDGGLHGEEYDYIDKERTEKTCLTLGHILYSMPFKVLVPHDENRAADGKALRYYFSSLGDGYKDCTVLDRPFCSILEMLIGLTGRMDINILSEIDPPWDTTIQAKVFWMILNNLGITEEEYNDSKMAIITPEQSASDLANRIIKVKEILEFANNRLYDDSGKGGFFPLKNPKVPQKNLEIWYQMHSWVAENGL